MKITLEEWFAELERFEAAHKDPKLKWALTESEKRRLGYRKQGLTIPEIALKEMVSLRSIKGTFQNVKHKAKLFKESKTSI